MALTTIMAVFSSLQGRCEMFGLFSKEDPNLKRNRKAQKLRQERLQEQWQEQRQNLQPKPEHPLLKGTSGGKRTAGVIPFRG